MTEKTKLKFNVQLLSSDLSKSNKEVDSIKNELSKLVEKNLSMSAQIADLDQELASPLQKELDSSRIEKNNIEGELGRLIKKNSHSKIEVNRDSLSAKTA